MAGKDELRSKRLRDAIRKNKARLIVAEWTEALSNACGLVPSDIRFLSVERTQELTRAFVAFYHGIPSDKRRCVPANGWAEIEEKLKRLPAVVENLPVVLVSSLDEILGAAVVPAHSVLQNPKGVLQALASMGQVAGADLLMVTEDLASGLCVEFSYYDLHGKYHRDGVYELVGWGAFAC